jgi:hypothetical protein
VKRLAVLLLGLLAGGLLSGCARVAQDRDVVLAAIDATARLSRTYTYQVAEGGHSASARAVVADDFRYRVDASADGRATASEVVVDDSRALRLDSGQAAILMALAGGGDARTAAKLSTGHWLLDPAGAASLAQKPAATRPSEEPVTDALAVLGYVRNAVVQAQAVQRWNPQSESYRPRLDPFPGPAAGIVRYDLVPPDLPQREQVGSGNIGLENQVPGVPFFRLMAVYVRDGQVREVREQVAVEPRLQDSQSNLEARLGDFVSGVPADASLAQRARALLVAVNRQLARRGQAPVAPRSMHLTFTSLGSAPPVSLPQDATRTDLSVLGGHGLILYESS